MKRTGTDISIRVCRSEGYAVVEHDGNKMNPNHPYRCTVSDPNAWTGAGHHRLGLKKFMHDERVSYVQLWARFQFGGEDVKKFCDFADCPFPAPDSRPSFEDMAALYGIVTGAGL